MNNIKKYNYGSMLMLDSKLSLSDFAIKYRNIDVVIDISDKFDFSFADKLQRLGHFYLWVPCYSTSRKQWYDNLGKTLEGLNNLKKKTLLFSNDESKKLLNNVKKIFSEVDNEHAN